MSDKREADTGNKPERTGAVQDESSPDSGGELSAVKEVGGRPGPEPTRFGDWEKNGRCIDF
jgi:hypothetical protein